MSLINYFLPVQSGQVINCTTRACAENEGERAHVHTRFIIQQAARMLVYTTNRISFYVQYKASVTMRAQSQWVNGVRGGQRDRVL